MSSKCANHVQYFLYFSWQGMGIGVPRALLRDGRQGLLPVVAVVSRRCLLVHAVATIAGGAQANGEWLDRYRVFLLRG